MSDENNFLILYKNYYLSFLVFYYLSCSILFLMGEAISLKFLGSFELLYNIARFSRKMMLCKHYLGHILENLKLRECGIPQKQ